MKYKVGKQGRVFVARLDDGESIYDCVEEIAWKENIKLAQVVALGGIRKGKLVVGPQRPQGPIEPMTREFNDARELVGVGTLVWDDEGPKLHLHTAIGRGDQALVGCPRIEASTFLVLEVVITEITDIQAQRKLEPESGLKLLTLG